MAVSDKKDSISVTVADSASVSSGQSIDGRGLLGIIAPACTASTAYLLYQVSMDDSTYYPLQDTSGTVVSTAVSTSDAIAAAVDPTKFLGWRFVKLQTVQSDKATAQAQTGAKAFSLIVGPILSE